MVKFDSLEFRPYISSSIHPSIRNSKVLIHLIKSGMTADNQNEVEEALSPSPEQVRNPIFVTSLCHGGPLGTTGKSRSQKSMGASRENHRNTSGIFEKAIMVITRG